MYTAATIKYKQNEKTVAVHCTGFLFYELIALFNVPNNKFSGLNLTWVNGETKSSNL